MAGHASNWYKPRGGALKGKAVYVSKAQRGGASRSDVLVGLEQGVKEWLDVANTATPDGVARVADMNIQPTILIGSRQSLNDVLQTIKNPWFHKVEESRDPDEGYPTGLYTIYNDKGKSFPFLLSYDEVENYARLGYDFEELDYELASKPFVASAPVSVSTPKPATPIVQPPQIVSAKPSAQPMSISKDMEDSVSNRMQKVADLQKKAYESGSPEYAIYSAFKEMAQAWRAVTALRQGLSKTGITGVQSAAMKKYQGIDYQKLNDMMWGSAVAPGGALNIPNSPLRSMAESLMSASKNQPAPVSFRTYRVVSAEHPLHYWAMQASVGSVYLNKGFDSTSLDPSVQPVDAKGKVATRLIFDVPKGASGLLFSGTPNYTDQKTEMEWLSPANSQWAVKEVRNVNGVREVVVSLVAQRDLDGTSVWPHQGT